MRALSERGNGVSLAEMRPGKWTTEGEVNGFYAKYPRRVPALTAENVLAFLFKRAHFINESIKVVPQAIVCP